METRLKEIISYAIHLQATDIHFTWNECMLIECRVHKRFMLIPTKEKDEQLFSYLQYLSNMDLSSFAKPQSGAFELEINNYLYAFRFAILMTSQHKSGVLRILNYHQAIPLQQLILKGEHRKIFKQWCSYENGLILIGGPTSSGKTTTAYSLLNHMNKRKIYTLEDPVEIYFDSMVQIQINPKISLTYDEGIKQLLRHDPDVIFIGEIRDEVTAKMAIRCALTGHLVISTIHESSCRNMIHRLLDLGISKYDLEDVLVGLANQRLFQLHNKQKRVSLYELYQREDILDCLHHKESIYPSFQKEIAYAYQKRWISFEDAQRNIV